MLRKRWQFLRHCVDILLGRRRSYQPGALTAKIFIEFDRAQAQAARTAQAAQTAQTAQNKAAKPASAHRSSPRSKKNSTAIKAQRLTIRNDRIVVKSVRKPLAVGRNVNRPVVNTEAASTKRLSHRVIWLGKTATPISTSIGSGIGAQDSKTRTSNVVALHRLEPVSRPGVRIAA